MSGAPFISMESWPGHPLSGVFTKKPSRACSRLNKCSKLKITMRPGEAMNASGEDESHRGNSNRQSEDWRPRQNTALEREATSRGAGCRLARHCAIDLPLVGPDSRRGARRFRTNSRNWIFGGIRIRWRHGQAEADDASLKPAIWPEWRCQRDLSLSADVR